MWEKAAFSLFFFFRLSSHLSTLSTSVLSFHWFISFRIPYSLSHLVLSVFSLLFIFFFFHLNMLFLLQSLLSFSTFPFKAFFSSCSFSSVLNEDSAREKDIYNSPNCEALWNKLLGYYCEEKLSTEAAYLKLVGDEEFDLPISHLLFSSTPPLF